MKSFPYFEFMVFVLPGGFFSGLIFILLSYLLHIDIPIIEEMGVTLSLIFVLSSSLLLGHFLGIIANKIENILWRNKKYNAILLKFHDLQFSQKKKILNANKHSRKSLKENIFSAYSSVYNKIEVSNQLDTIAKLYAQGRFAQNCMVAFLLNIIIYLVCYFCSYTDFSIYYTFALSVGCIYSLILFVDRDNKKVNKTYQMFIALDNH